MWLGLVLMWSFTERDPTSMLCVCAFDGKVGDV